MRSSTAFAYTTALPVSAATLSHRYISDRFLPDKAIDLVDEACALVRTEIDSMPSELDDMRRRIMQLEIEEMALKKETDTLSKKVLSRLTKELAELKDSFNEMKAAGRVRNPPSKRLSILRGDRKDERRNRGRSAGLRV